MVNDLVPWSDYVASTKLTKDATDYDTDNVATTLIKRMQKRDPEKVVAVGDRFSYLIVESSDKKAKKRDICELTKEVVEQNLTINIDYYLDNVMGNTIAKFLNIAGLQGKEVNLFIDSCKKPEYCEKLVPKKRQKVAPTSLGGANCFFVHLAFKRKVTVVNLCRYAPHQDSDLRVVSETVAVNIFGIPRVCDLRGDGAGRAHPKD